MGETLRRLPLREVLEEHLERVFEEVSALASAQSDGQAGSPAQLDGEASLEYLFSDAENLAQFLREAQEVLDPGPSAQPDREVGFEHPFSDAEAQAESLEEPLGEAHEILDPDPSVQPDREASEVLDPDPPAQADRQVDLEHPFSGGEDPAQGATRAIRDIVRLARAVDMLLPGEKIKKEDDFDAYLFLRRAYMDLVTGGVNQGVLCAYYGHLLDILSREGEKQGLGGTALYSEVKWQAKICRRIIDALQGRKEGGVDDQELKARCQGGLGAILEVVNRIKSYDDCSLVPIKAQHLLTVEWGVSFSDLAGAFDTVEKSGPFCLDLSAIEVFSILLGYISTIDNFIRQTGGERPEENLRVRRKRYEEMIEILKQKDSSE